MAETEGVEPTPRDFQGCAALSSAVTPRTSIFRRCACLPGMRRDSSHAFPTRSAPRVTAQGRWGRTRAFEPRPRGFHSYPRSRRANLLSVVGYFFPWIRAIACVFWLSPHIGAHTLKPACYGSLQSTFLFLRKAGRHGCHCACGEIRSTPAARCRLHRMPEPCRRRITPGIPRRIAASRTGPATMTAAAQRSEITNPPCRRSSSTVGWTTEVPTHQRHVRSRRRPACGPPQP